MGINVVITGAGGRMGKTLQTVITRHQDLHLAGLVEQKDNYEECLKDAVVPVCTDLKEMLDKIPGAVVLDFTAPTATLNFAEIVAQSDAKLVIGTTGLNDGQKSALSLLAQKAPIFWSPNMSIGINVLLQLLPELTRSLGQDYDVEVMEMHHKHKKDSPSGTAVRLGEALAKAKNWNYNDVACCHREGLIGERPEEQIGVQTIRGGDVVGVHTVYFMGPGERIEINHQAHSRENFANGAMRAVKWLY
ncbi:MAG: 4-hydroxy-tetrahydrodipicolinate reductase, partial [Deltaproteobacteria bacterium]|nr:4-hydroxy-tetrahydrodipicolinate reductase [Deltaproteobacteria bacterium]